MSDHTDGQDERREEEGAQRTPAAAEDANNNIDVNTNIDDNINNNNNGNNSSDDGDSNRDSGHPLSVEGEDKGKERAKEKEPLPADDAAGVERRELTEEELKKQREQEQLREELVLGPEGIFTATQLQLLNESRDTLILKELGGVETLARGVKTDLKRGLKVLNNQAEMDWRMESYGENVHKQPPSKNIVRLFFEALKDPMLLILLVLAVISIVLGVTFPENESERALGWIEGAAIIAAVLIVSCVTAFNDWSKERKFRSLNAASKEIDIKVLRDGENEDLLISKLQVGEIIELETGDQVPADGLVVECFDFKTDESVMTGETDLIKKNADTAPFLLSGCHVAEGNCKMLVTGVGPYSEWGKTLAKLADAEESKTPLEEKLEKLAELIGYMGISFAVMTFSVLVIGFLIKKTLDTLSIPPHDHWHIGDLGAVVRYVIISVTIVVVAVPEGLPLAVTISLAYSVQRMMKDNNLVRHLAACETMGGATNICSDKTGTLTLNQMRVVQGWFSNSFYQTEMPTLESFSNRVVELLADGISINSKANLIEHDDQNKGFEVQGNKTEGAMLIMIKDFDRDYHEVRQYYEETKRLVMMYTFSSKKKRMSCIVRTHEDDEDDHPFRLYCKGASEIVLGYCTKYLDNEGNVVEMDDDKKTELQEAIEAMATKGLRTICLAYKPLAKDTKPLWEEDQEAMEQDMICIAIVGIKDPLRPEVPPAVRQCKKSGIVVRMVTGDNILTAQHIARDCGILDDGGIALEGPVFRRMSDSEIDAVLPRLQVLARSSPSDKHRLVNRLKKHGEVVAVTGDGTNDAPALKEADVGLSMGISGTQVAKEASDIIIMDDNFKSIVQSVLWGRSIFENIRKFLTFQLTVNVVALTITVITSITSFIPMPGFESGHREPPLTAVQLLWVNLIMDTFAALALATEPPLPELLDRKPYGRKESLITSNMWIQLLGQSVYQLIILCVLYYAGPYMGIWPVESNNSVVFNSFVLAQLFNEFNARKINHEFNIFENILASPMFLGIVAVTAVAQFLIVTFGGPVTQTVPLTFLSWVICVVLGALCIPWGMGVRILGQFINKVQIKKQQSQEGFKVIDKEDYGTSEEV